MLGGNSRVHELGELGKRKRGFSNLFLFDCGMEGLTGYYDIDRWWGLGSGQVIGFGLLVVWTYSSLGPSLSFGIISDLIV